MDGENDNILDAEQQFEIAALKQEIDKLKKEVIKYKILLKEVDEEANPNIVSDEETICVEQISKLKEESQKRQLSTDEVKKLDLLHKNLKLARGEDIRVKTRGKANKLTAAELAEIAKGK